MPRASPSRRWRRRARQWRDVLLIDTAGRLQNKAGLMAELEKIVRVIKKLDATAPHAVLLVLDATTGQNAIVAGRSLQGRRAADRPGHDQARRHRQGRHPGGAGRQIRPCRCISSASAKAQTICRPSTPQAFAKALTGAA